MPLWSSIVFESFINIMWHLHVLHISRPLLNSRWAEHRSAKCETYAMLHNTNGRFACDTCSKPRNYRVLLQFNYQTNKSSFDLHTKTAQKELFCITHWKHKGVRISWNGPTQWNSCCKGSCVFWPITITWKIVIVFIYSNIHTCTCTCMIFAGTCTTKINVCVKLP